MSAAHHDRWSAQEDKTLVELRESGLTFRGVSFQMKRSPRACIARYHILKNEDGNRSAPAPAPASRPHPGETPPRQSFMNPHAEALIARAKAKADKLIEAGTAVDAALNMVAQEYDIRLNPDDFALRPVGEAAHRVLDLMTAEGRRAFMKAGA